MKYLNIILLLLFSNLLISQSTRILLDGHFSDWDNVSVAHTDSNGDDGWSNIDFGKIWITNDEQYLFIRIETGSEFNLQSDNTVTLYIDTDQNPNTGRPFNGIGAELTYVFGERFGIARFNNFNYFIDHIDINLVSGPTVAGTQFEIAIDKNTQISSFDLFPDNSVTLAFQDDISNGDQLPNQSGGINYTFSDDPISDLPAFGIAKPAGETFRAISYNVLQDGFFDSFKEDEFERILQALDPDIIGFQEIYSHTSNQIKNQVESMLPSSGGAQWYHSKVNPDIAIVSRFPIKQAFIIGGANGGANGAFLLELPAPFNSELLFINAHTPCCDNDNARQFEIDAMMAFVRDAKAGNGPMPIDDKTPIIVMGDMNLVGSKENLETLITGNIVNQGTFGASFAPDWDGSEFEDLLPFATNTPMAFTWHDQFSSFSPGRLDGIFYSGSVLKKKNAFTLFTSALSDQLLTTYNLKVDDTAIASDHLPLVADFEINKTSSTASPSKWENVDLKVFPNPTPNNFTIKCVLPKSSRVKITMHDVLGKPLMTIFEGEKTFGEHVFEAKNVAFPNGLYLIQVDSDFGNYFSTILIQH